MRFRAQLGRPLESGRDRALREQVAGLVLEQAHLLVAERVLGEAVAHGGGVEHLVGDTVLAGAEQGPRELGGIGRPHVQATGHEKQLAATLLGQLPPELERPPRERHVPGALVVGGPDDPRAAVVRPHRVRWPEAVEAGHLDAPLGQPPERHAAHRAETDDEHVGVHQRAPRDPSEASTWSPARWPLRTAPSMFACQV
jgi:hypothetical protein